MKNIKKGLIENGYEIYSEGDYFIQGFNEFLRIEIIKKDKSNYMIGIIK